MRPLLPTAPVRLLAALLLVLTAWPALAAGPGTTPADPPRLPRVHLHGDALAGGARRLDVDQIDALAKPRRWTLLDPYKGRETVYQGIALRDLVAAVAPDAARVRMRAINDYIAVFSRDEWETLPILLATRENDERMAVAAKGPARIVYRQTHENEREMQVHAPKWIWQVVDVEFLAR